MLHALTGTALLQAWEMGERRHAIDRALVLLWAGHPDGHPPQTLAELTIGQRDALLLDLRAATLGDQMAAHAVCPECEAELEFPLCVSELRDPAQPMDATATFSRQLDDWQVRLRCPNSRDLADTARRDDPLAARASLLERCVVDARDSDGRSTPVAELPDTVLDAIASALAERDPQADIRIDLVCPDCGHCWQLGFDIAAFLWDELAASAQRLLREVARLARGFGWSEADILAMTPARRGAYLGLLG